MLELKTCYTRPGKVYFTVAVSLTYRPSLEEKGRTVVNDAYFLLIYQFILCGVFVLGRKCLSTMGYIQLDNVKG